MSAQSKGGTRKGFLRRKTQLFFSTSFFAANQTKFFVSFVKPQIIPVINQMILDSRGKLFIICIAFGL